MGQPQPKAQSVSNRPSHHIKIGEKYTTKDGREKMSWMSIGAAWPIEKQPGAFKLKLKATPVEGGTMYLFPINDDTQVSDVAAGLEVPF